jgi:hypothetical protein
MAADNKLELVVEVDVNKANASIKSVNTGLSSMEQTAANAARGASRGIDGMTAAMVKGAAAGSLLADAIKGALQWAKSWTLGAVQAAAHEARLEASMKALAKAHGISEGAALAQAQAVRQIGFYGEEATHTISRMIVADMDLSKGTGLAKLAKDAAAIENISAGEAMEKLLLAVEGGVSRGLRSMGLFVDFNKEVELQQLRTGKTLSESEVKQVRYNAVMREGAKIAGAHAAAQGEAEAMVKKFQREMVELREAIGARFQDQYKSLVSHLKDAASWLKDNVDLLAKFGQVAMWVSGIMATYAIASKIAGIADAVRGLSVALAANPWTLLATGVLAAGAVIYTTWKDTQAQMQARVDEMERQALRQDLLSGKTGIEDLHKRGMSDDQIRELVSGRRELTGGQPFEFGDPKITVTTGNEPDVDALKRAAEIRKKQAEVTRDAQQAAIESGAKSQLGFARQIAEVNAQVAKWTTFTDDKGQTQRITLTRDAWAAVIEQLRNRWAAFYQDVTKQNREALADHLKDVKEAADKQIEVWTEMYQRRLQFEGEVAQRNVEHAEQVYGYQEQRAGYGRDAQLRAVEATNAQTLAQKAAVEQRKLEIEVEYIERVSEIKLRLFDMETSRMALEEEATLRRLGYRADEIQARIGELTQQREDVRQQQQEGTEAAVEAARENAAIRQANLIRDHNRQIFDSLKQQAGGVFDALLTKSQSIWSAIGNSLKTALLTAIKDVVTSRVAAMLMQLFTGQKMSFASAGSGGGGGVLGGIGGLLGAAATPVFGGGGTLGAQGGAGGLGAQGASGGSATLGGAPWANMGATGANYLAGLKSFLGMSGSISTGAGSATTWGAATMGQKMTAIGKSNAALMGGAMLAMDGLRRGGALGLAETTAGGAMIGYKYGGGVGAAIGAAVGFTAGIIRLFIKGAQEKARAKVKAAYGVDISDMGLLKQIVDTAKQAYGGDLDMAIRSTQIRELVMTYAMMTGQKTSGIPTAPRAISMVQSGGSLYESAGFVNGAAQSSISGLSTFDRIGSGAPSNAGPMVIRLDGPATTALLRGEAVQAIADNPRAVQSAAMSATRSNAGRRELLSLQLSPGTLTS